MNDPNRLQRDLLRESYAVAQNDLLIEKIKSVVEETGVPPEYDIRIYKNEYACMDGLAGPGVTIEVVGPEKE